MHNPSMYGSQYFAIQYYIYQQNGFLLLILNPVSGLQAVYNVSGFQAFLENVLVPDCLLYLAPGSHF